MYGQRMVNEVDRTRYSQAFIRAVRKDFSDDEQVGPAHSAAEYTHEYIINNVDMLNYYIHTW